VVRSTGGPAAGYDLAGFQQAIAAFLAAFPGIRFTVVDQVAAGDRVAMRWVAEGVHGGPLGPVPATGRPVRVEGIVLDRVAGGRVAERWEQWDQPGLLGQLGLA
jgi:predicted ester cyclase